MILRNEQGRIVAYLDGSSPIGDLRQVKVNALWKTQPSSFHFGDCYVAACAIRERGSYDGSIPQPLPKAEVCDQLVSVCKVM